MIHIFDEDSAVPMSIANGAGIGINRNAIGPLTVTLPGEAVLGDSFELHAVEVETFTVAFPATHGLLHGEVLATSVVFSGGGSIKVTKTKPAAWSALISGNYKLNS